MYQSFRFCLSMFVLLFSLFLEISPALQTNPPPPPPPHHHHQKQVVYQTIFVNKNGGANFTTIQKAIDSVPSNNKNWICIYIKKGVYREQISIPLDKPFIYLKGDGKRKTYVVWDENDSIATSATFSSHADNIIASSISFVNSYNSRRSGKPMKTAVAALIEGDKSTFYQCGFFGLQDTLWDVQGRHYFRECTIQGAVDFIFGAGQSLYESCTISVVAGALNGAPGYITAQARLQPNDSNGFVFKYCNISGNGKTYLGRAWRQYARVIFYKTTMSGIVVPQGWDAWSAIGREYQLTFAEYRCIGSGSHKTGRVKWSSQLNKQELKQMIRRKSFIDVEGWSTLALNILLD